MSGSKESSTDPWAIVLGIFALSNLANGAWMLVDPTHWYLNLPANIPGSGPLNEHFVRDIGCIFALAGIGLAIGVFRPSARYPALLFTSGFFGMHAAVHVLDSARGLFDADQWKLDLVPVYGATLLLFVVTYLYARSREVQSQ